MPGFGHSACFRGSFVSWCRSGLRPLALCPTGAAVWAAVTVVLLASPYLGCTDLGWNRWVRWERCMSFLEELPDFSTAAAPFCVPRSSAQGFQAAPLPTLVISSWTACLASVRWHLAAVICVSLMTSNVEHLSRAYWLLAHLLWTLSV